jgi:hypothetical protein
MKKAGNQILAFLVNVRQFTPQINQPNEQSVFLDVISI